MITTYERGMMAERLRIALHQLEAKFGPLPPDVKQCVEGLSPGQLNKLLLDLVKAQSLQELHLQNSERLG